MNPFVGILGLMVVDLFSSRRISQRHRLNPLSFIDFNQLNAIELTAIWASFSLIAVDPCFCIHRLNASDPWILTCYMRLPN